jgi:hypothetical protein
LQRRAALHARSLPGGVVDLDWQHSLALVAPALVELVRCLQNGVLEWNRDGLTEIT